MLSLETAKRLKDAGVFPGVWGIEGVSEVYRLSQLLAEIERRGWSYTLESKHRGMAAEMGIYKPHHRAKLWFGSEITEEAAAEALLWILDCEKND